MRIVAVGDIMPGGIWNGHQGVFVTEEVLSVLRQADIRVGTLETAIGNEPTFYKEKMARRADVIYAKDEDLKRLKDLDLNLVSLANNHFYDLGLEGAEHTIALLDNLGIQHCGAGRNIEEASRPVVFEKGGKSFAFLAFCDWREETVGWCPFATETESGVNPMYDDYVIEQISKYKQLYDFVVVIPHWGKEHSFITTRHVYQLAKKMLDAGADMIFGGHTHRIQPVVRRRNSVTAYSMGNFFFPDRLIVKPRSTYYPEEPIALHDLPITDGYPFVERTTLKIWKPLARIGEMVTVSIGDRGMASQTDYVKLNEKNVLGTYALPFSIRLVMGWQKLWLKYMPYPGYEFFLIRLRKLLKRLF
ncbi:MAG: CapA family protein [bacterium]|nr:CapA family protein [bacterium]